MGNTFRLAGGEQFWTRGLYLELSGFDSAGEGHSMMSAVADSTRAISDDSFVWNFPGQ